MLANYQGSSVREPPTGLNALTLYQYREIAIVHAPNAAKDVVKAVIRHCQQNRFRFAVVDSPSGVASFSSINPRDGNDTAYAAFYHPWIVIDDPSSNARKTVPPGGCFCGIYARTDDARGVFSAPANEIVAGAIDLEFDITRDMQERVNPKGVNCIRRFRRRGIHVWGARKLSSDYEWKYVNVRRLLIFLEHSIHRGLHWVVFEPNDQRLWARVREGVSEFLRAQWRLGALLSQKESEAFLVSVGPETMTEDDILNGRIIVVVGVAPVRPAEFVVFRICQKTQEAANQAE